MEAKLKDLLKSGLVLIKSVDLDRFVKCAVANGIFPRIGNRYNECVIVMVEG